MQVCVEAAVVTVLLIPREREAVITEYGVRKHRTSNNEGMLSPLNRHTSSSLVLHPGRFAGPWIPFFHAAPLLGEREMRPVVLRRPRINRIAVSRVSVFSRYLWRPNEFFFRGAAGVATNHPTDSIPHDCSQS